MHPVLNALETAVILMVFGKHGGDAYYIILIIIVLSTWQDCAMPTPITLNEGGVCGLGLGRCEVQKCFWLLPSVCTIILCVTLFIG